MSAPSSGETVSAPSTFTTTRWTMVLDAGSDTDSGRQALDDLCRAYWLPLFLYLRRRGHAAPDAEDLTQGFFADLLSRGAIKRADRTRGRFRGFLLTSLINYVHNAHDRAQAVRRGGSAQVLSIDVAQATGALEQFEAEGLSPDRAFDRAWALAVFDRALCRLRAEQVKLGKGSWFERLRPLLQAGLKPGDYDAIAAEFDVSKNVVAVALHRLNGRYREFVREEIAETVSSPDEVEAELRKLLESLSS